MNLSIRTGKDFVNFRPFFPTNRPLTDEKISTRNEMIRLFDEVSGKETHDLCTW